MRSLLGGGHFVALLLLASAASHAQIPSRNVNLVSGTGWPGGDPFLQRQNEPTIAISTRNPMHLLAGANDYRTVDLPGLPDDVVTGDAWLGVFTSYDGGATWRSTLLPGYPQDAGSSSPLFGFEAAADPVVRAGTHGLFYYSGIAFDRSNPVIVSKMGRPAPRAALAGVGGASSAVFVARFIDNNNKENAEPIAHLGTTVVVDNTADAVVFLDKPWLAVDMPRKQAGTCTVTQTLGEKTVTQTLPAGNVYVAWARFTGSAAGGDIAGRIFFSRSRDCGSTWSTPVELSGAHHVNQGATIAVDPRTGTVYAAWRRFKYPLGSSTPTESDAILLARSFDGGASFTPPEVVASFEPFDQGTAETRFRTNAYPALAVDRHGRVFVLFSARGFQPQGDARVVLTQARFPSRAAATFVDEDDGTETPGPADPKASWSAPAPVDSDLSRRGHQIMPTAIVAGSRLQVSYVDLQEDHTWAEWARDAQGVWRETRIESEERAGNPAGVFQSDRIDDLAPPLVTRRHTADAWVAQATLSDSPAFACRRASSYEAGVRPDAPGKIQQLRFNPPNLPLFKLGTAPFWGDYIDLGSLAFEQKNKNKWRYATKADTSYLTFTDNRDVRPPLDGRWDLYTPPASAMAGSTSLFDGTSPVSPCDPAHPERAGMRNQNVYLARMTQGLFVGVPGNAKPLGALQRAFVVTVENQTFQMRTFRLTITNVPAQGVASFRQFSVLTSIDAAIAPRSSISRTVFVQAPDPKASVEIAVQETNGGLVVPPTRGGLEGQAVINPEMLNPEMVNPEMVNPEMVNEDVLSVEVHTPEMVNPEMVNPEMVNPEMVNPEMVNPEMVNPEMVNPEMLNPEMVNPEMVNPEMVNPEMVNPEMVNTDLVNGSLTDTTWTITNLGNTTSAYDIQLVLRNTEVPEGFKTQLILYKTYTTPVTRDCTLREEAHNVLIASIPDPRLDPPGTNLPYDPADGSLQHATLWLAPGESARVTLRVIDPDKDDDITFEPIREVVAGVKSQAVDTDDAASGVTDPPLVTPSPIVFLQGPSATPVGGIVSPTVQVLVRDDSGMPVPFATAVLSLSLNPTGATLHNATATTDADGVASFPDLWLDRVGVGYRLQATAGTVSTAATAPFDVVALIVETTYDTGPGSLREAIHNANRNAGFADAISFNIPGAGPHTIALVSALPVIVDPLTIDATTQPGYAGSPVVELSGTGTNGPGLDIAGGGSAVRGLAINGFGLLDGSPGIRLGGTGSVIQGNFIGTDPSGTVARPNNEGILVVASSNNLIGGTVPRERNVIAGNLADGVNISSSLSTGNQIVGNYIGADATGSAALSTGQFGVYISNAPDNVVGGSEPGSGNVITASTFNGIRVSGSAAQGNRVLGNRIGTNASGTAALGNAQAGIWLGDESSQTVVGGAAPSHRNLVSGNSEGIRILGSHHNTVEGNYVGTNAAGDAAIGNTGASGIWISGDDNVLRGNLVSGNSSWGVLLIGSHRNQLEANLIGTSATGTAAVPNAAGVSYSGDAPADHTIRNNVISGNSYYGIWLTAADHFTIAGNKIGTTPTGDAALPNGSPGYASAGLEMDGCIGSTIGGAAPGAGNVVSGNRGDGILLRTYGLSGIVDCVVEGNVVGTDAAGALALPNTGVGVRVSPSLPAPAPMSNFVIDRNLVSGNALEGLSLENGVHHLTVSRNTIGTNAAGDAPLPNGGSGVQMFGDVHDVVVGGSDTTANLISGNKAHGVLLVAPGPPVAMNNEISWNRIGTNRTGTLAIGNEMYGIAVAGAQARANRIAANLISGNRFSGVSIAGDAHDNVVDGNRIGTTADGTAPLPNLESGIYVTGHFNQIGGSTPGEGNLISGNTGSGITLFNAHDNVLEGNRVGTDEAGSAALGNNGSGIVLGGASTSGVTVRGNLVSGNTNGIDFVNQAHDNRAIGNFVGTNAAGSAAIGNTMSGVRVSGMAYANTIGGVGPDEGNLISGNYIGVALSLSGGSNRVLGNRIGTNDLGTSAIPNTAPGISMSSTTDDVIGTTDPGGGNLISGNGDCGINMAWATGATVAGNRIGTNQAGSAAIGNTLSGICIFSSNSGDNLIADNLISGNHRHGVEITNDANGNRLVRNIVGADALGTSGLPNDQVGIFLRDTANNVVGGPGGVDGNTIAFNPLGGIAYSGTGANAFGSNRIHSNGRLGIDLDGLFVTPNDLNDPDSGPNDLVNFPVLLSAVDNGSQTTVTGTLDLEPIPGVTVTIQFFSNAVCDPLGHGEGERYEGEVVATTDGNGDAPIVASLGAGLLGRSVTATTTVSTVAAGGKTSEFSACILVVP